MNKRAPQAERFLFGKSTGSTSAHHVVRVAGHLDGILKGLFLLAVFYTFYFARDVLLPVVLALLLTLILGPTVRGLKRLHVPEPVGAGLVVLTLITAVGFGLYALIDPATAWIEKVHRDP